MLKFCIGCKLNKNVSEFNKKTEAKDGLQPRCRDCNKIYLRKWFQDNKEYCQNKTKNWSHNNRDRVNKYAQKKRENINYRISSNLRSRIRLAMKNNQKHGHTLELLGCSVEKFKTHLEKQFTSEMSWQNYGSYWEIDHIKPCTLFDLSDNIQQKECFHYSNMQPLEVTKNRSKSDNYE